MTLACYFSSHRKLPQRFDQHVASAAGVGLQMRHRDERGLVRLERGTRDTVLDDTAGIPVLMGIGKRIVHTHIGESAYEKQRGGIEAFQQNLQVCSKKRRIAAFA